MNDESIVSMLWIQTVTRYLEVLGVDAEPLLREFDLTAEAVERSDSWAPVSTLVGLQERAAESLKDPYFGARLGSSYEPRHGGPLGYSMSNARTVRQSLRMIIRYQAMHLRGATVCLTEQDDEAHLTYRIDDRRIGPRCQDAEAVVAVGIRMVQSLGFPKWAPIRVLLEHERRAGAHDLESFFRAPARFGHHTNGLVLERPLLDEPVQGADPDLGSVLERHLDLLARRPPKVSQEKDALVHKVREAIAGDLKDGDPALERVASSLAMSGRTLQRELRKRSTAFRSLVEDLRHDLAIEYMQEPDTAITQIAFMLGYSELSAFDRAFRRWTGTSPMAHRRGASA